MSKTAAYIMLIMLDVWYNKDWLNPAMFMQEEIKAPCFASIWGTQP